MSLRIDPGDEDLTSDGSTGGLSAVRGVLWDMDGTLIDSAEYHWLTWRDALAAEGVALTRDDFNSWFGSRNDRILRRYFGDDIIADEIARIGDAKEARYRAMVRDRGVEPLPGVREWLARLHGEGWRQAVASSAPPANIEVLLEVLRFGEMFQAYVSAEEVPNGKPHPDVFLRAAQRLGVPSKHCIVVEDAPVGVEAGRRAGMKTVGVTWLHGRLDADVQTPTLADLPPDAFARLLEGS
jgi:beta-phosphoglucomutase